MPMIFTSRITTLGQEATEINIRFLRLQPGSHRCPGKTLLLGSLLIFVLEPEKRPDSTNEWSPYQVWDPGGGHRNLGKDMMLPLAPIEERVHEWFGLWRNLGNVNYELGITQCQGIIINSIKL